MQNIIKKISNFLGPALGSFLYEIGGFLLPFEVVGCWCLLCKFEKKNIFFLFLNKIDFTKKNTLFFLGAFGILFTIPNVKMKTLEETDGIIGKKLTIKDLIKVRMSFFLNNVEKLEPKSLYKNYDLKS